MIFHNPEIFWFYFSVSVLAFFLKAPLTLSLLSSKSVVITSKTHHFDLVPSLLFFSENERRNLFQRNYAFGLFFTIVHEFFTVEASICIGFLPLVCFFPFEVVEYLRIRILWVGLLDLISVIFLVTYFYFNFHVYASTCNFLARPLRAFTVRSLTSSVSNLFLAGNLSLFFFFLAQTVVEC